PRRRSRCEYERVRAVQDIARAPRLGLFMAGVHVIVNLLIAAGAVALVFNVAIERAAGAALAIVKNNPGADAAAGRAGVSQIFRALAAIIFRSRLAIGVAEDVRAFDGAG